MKNARKPLIATIALGVALAAPMAFAQDAATPAQDAAQPAPAQGYAQDATAEAPQAQQGQITWASLDTDGDGKLSQSEAAGLEGLTQVFSEVDADGDGSITPEEYRDFVTRQSGGASVSGE